MEHREILRSVKRILLIDYPGRVVPDSLARAGYSVVAHEGPGPLEYYSYLVEDGEVVRSEAGPAPEHVDLVHSYRPADELPPIVEEARRLGASAVWTLSGRNENGEVDHRSCWVSEDERAKSRGMIEAAGMIHIDRPFILDAIAESDSA
jgi:predicted CoA-binding protein